MHYNRQTRRSSFPRARRLPAMPDALDTYGDAIRDAERAAAAGDFARAETALREALDLQEQQLGAGHPDLASTLNNLAVVCETNGGLADAEQFYRRAFAVASAALPPGDSLVETSRANLEDFCRAHGRAVDDWPELSHRPPSGVAEPAAPPPARVAPAALTTSAAPPAVAPSTAASSAPGPAAPATAAARPAPVPTPVAPASQGAAPRGFVAALAALALVGTGALAWFAFRPGDPPPPATAASPATASREAPAPVAPSVTPVPPPEEPAPAAPPAVPATPAATRPETSSPATRDVAAATPPLPVELPRAARPVPAPESVEPAPDSAGGAARLIEASVCSRLSRQGRQWTCTPAGNGVSGGTVSFYTRVATARAARIEHRWYRNETLARAITLSVGASVSEGYRTFSQQTVTPGRWRVEARTTDGRVLGDVSFEVRD